METIRITCLPVKPGDILLDIGCGEGRHTLAANHYFPTAKIFALDINDTDIRTAKSKHTSFIGHSKNYLYIHGNGFHLPFADNSLDHIICSEVLEHIESIQMLLKEIKRTLKPGGNLSISVPRAWPEKICWYLSDAYHNVDGGHIRIFERTALQSMIETLDMHYERHHWAHALHSPYWWLRCLFWREQDPQHLLVRIYHKLLVWDLLQQPWLTRTLEKLLNPIMGKSVVIYFKNKN